jgi:RTX calcium-binding nonapeptide repeat (4 copies)
VEWTPDGRVAFVAGTHSVRTMTTAGTHIRQVGDGRQPAWSPDGGMVVVTVFGDVEPFSDRLDVLAIGGSPRRPLTRSSYPVQDFEADWQPLCTRRGGPHGDLISGTRRDDLLCGLGGADVIDGGGGKDRLFGGPGPDSILSRDGEFDVVGCGSGRDVVVADGLDLTGVDCERVRRR